MKYLLILVIGTLGVLCSPFGSSADVIDTDVSITLEDVVSEAAFTAIVSTDVMVLSGIESTYAIKAWSQPVLFIETDDYRIAINPTNDVNQALRWESRHYRKGIGKLSVATVDINLEVFAYRFARDGLIIGKASA